MINVTDIGVYGFESAVRGMRNPMNSWDRSDSFIDLKRSRYEYVIGKNDLKLMKQLIGAGSEHRKFLRMIHIQMDVTAPLYWWKEFDTYKVGTVANSCSTMHRIHEKEITLDDFSHEHLCDDGIELLEEIIEAMNTAREYFNDWDSNTEIDKEHFKKKDMWWQMIQLLPSSYNQLRTLDFNYETALSIIRQRQGHKLDEWRVFCEELLKLPYMRELSEADNEKKKN